MILYISSKPLHHLHCEKLFYCFFSRRACPVCPTIIRKSIIQKKPPPDSSRFSSVHSITLLSISWRANDNNTNSWTGFQKIISCAPPDNQSPPPPPPPSFSHVTVQPPRFDCTIGWIKRGKMIWLCSKLGGHTHTHTLTQSPESGIYRLAIKRSGLSSVIGK